MKIFLRYCFVLVIVLLQKQLIAQSTIPANLICCQTLVSGDVQLTWGASAEFCGPFVEYQIYRSNSFAGPYVLLSSIPVIGTSTFIDVGADGTVLTWYYYVIAVYTCPGFTMTTSDTLDNLDPVAPEIDLVSVAGGLSVLTWFPSPSPETNSYIIYRDNGGFNPIATVYGRFTTTFTEAVLVQPKAVTVTVKIPPSNKVALVIVGF